MLLPLLLLLAAADEADAPEPAPRKLAILDVSGDLAADKREELSKLVAARLNRFPSLTLVPHADVKAALDDDTKEQLASCDPPAKCLAELAGALHADLIAVPTAGKVSGSTVFKLQILDVHGATAAEGTATVSGLDDVTERITRAIDDVGRALTKEEPQDRVASAPPAAAPSTTTPTDGAQKPPALKEILLVGGAAGAGLGVVLVGLGAIPAFLASGAEGDLTGLRERYVDEPSDETLQQAKTKQQEVLDLRGMWNNGGLYVVWTGLLLTAAGGGVVGASFVVEE